ncbi:MAG TPA: dihydropteroate synthase [Verrucomicrobiae bacterium]|jgi:dihydropteroate synthase
MLSLEQLSDLLAQHREAASARVREFSIGGERFDFNSRPGIMGVINLSPDSWYRESVCLSTERAVERAKVLRAQGAQIIDIGAESTLSHAALLDDAAQQDKLLPIVRELAAARIPVSVETYRARVAQACLEAGASVINLTGTTEAAEIFRMASAHQAAVIICHVQGPNVRDVGDFDLSGDVVGAMHEYFSRLTELGTKHGAEKLLIDPGLGFYYRNLRDSAARVRHQMTTFLNSFRLRTIGFPVCQALPHAFEYFGEEVRCAEPFFAVLAALGKTDLFRTHEVSRVRPVLETLRLF